MMPPLISHTPQWQALADHHREIAARKAVDFFQEDSHRFEDFSLQDKRLEGLLFDFSKNLVTRQTMPLLYALLEAADFTHWRDAMFRGGPVNNTEGRAVLHTALRDPTTAPILVDGADIKPEIMETIKRLGAVAERVRQGVWQGATGKPIRHIVNIGIGGSDLGPRMVVEALAKWRHPNLSFHFIANIDGDPLARLLAAIPADETLVIVASKTFTTQETLSNAETVRRWLIEQLGDRAIARHCLAVTSAVERAQAFGVAREHIFPLWDWVGGRYSLWSAIGLPIIMAIGLGDFLQLLGGAHVMDMHFRSAPLPENIPVNMALVGIWNINFRGSPALAVLPYAEALHRLPAYLQQADMESNGKSVDRYGRRLDYATGPILFGEPGTNGQHAFYQLLHQGQILVACDFIGFAEPGYRLDPHHSILLANLLAQTEALMTGRSEAEAAAIMSKAGMTGDRLALLAAHRSFPGNRPVNTLLLPRLDPYWLGVLIALYEHKIFTQGILWGINCFDQWGVELGKELAKPILASLQGQVAAQPPAAWTNGLLQYLRQQLEREA